MAMASIEIRKSKSERLWSIGAPLLGVVALAFFGSVYLGLFVTAVAVVAVTIFSGDLKQFLANRPVVLVLNDSGLSITTGRLENTDIPWQDIEETGLSYGGKGGTMLGIRVRQPEKYVNRFTRALLVLSRFHIGIRVGGLEYSPREVMQKIEEARKAHA